jgi:hypothetical protein
MSKNIDNGRAVWSKEKQHHVHEEGAQCSDTNTSSAPQDTQQQPSYYQHSKPEHPLGGDATIEVAGYFVSQPQISSAYQQQPQRVFGQFLPITGPDQFVLDEEFRAAAKRSPMLWAFMQAVDQAEKEQQERAGERSEQLY